MLGAMVLDSVAKSGDFDVVATYRDKSMSKTLSQKYPDVKFVQLDAEKTDMHGIAAVITKAEWVINAIGVIKPYIHDDNAVETENAVRVNSLFPYELGRAAEQTGAQVIQIATDCAYSGSKGKYVETDLHDAIDVYGKTKSLGESYQQQFCHIRCSIIGPELKGHVSLLDWFLGQAKGATTNGFTNHQWNGVTTLHFARICQGIIKQNITLPRLHHLIPGNSITKANLLKAFAKEFDRSDITINNVKAPKVIDRTLATSNHELNRTIWQAAGYDKPPGIEQMVAELAGHKFATGDSKT